MTTPPTVDSPDGPAHRFPTATGAMADAIRQFDFSATPLGPIGSWPASLRTLTDLILRAREPKRLLWGPRLAQLYNDAWFKLIGLSTPAGLGEPIETAAPAFWSRLGPAIERSRQGESILSEAKEGSCAKRSVQLDPVIDDHGAIGGVMVSEVEWLSTREILKQLPFGVVITRGPDFVYEMVNRLAEQFSGLPASKLEGKPLVEAMPALKGTESEAWFKQTYRDGTSVQRRDVRVPVVPEGGGEPRIRYLDLGCEPIRRFDGQIEGLVTLGVDVTDRVEARQHEQAYLAEREKLLGALESANRAKDEFLALLGHELRNPLTPIVTALELMAHFPNSSHAREREVIGRQVDHMVRLVDDLLDVSRIARGKIELKPETVAVAEVITRAIEQVSGSLEYRRQRFDLEQPAGLRWTMDPTRIAQVIANLLTNASKYTPERGKISLEVRELTSALELTVRDAGVGIAPEMLPHVFEMFYQANRTVERSRGGLGLGLTLVKNLVELHGGEVSVASAGPGKGSAFTVLIPREPEVPRPSARPRPKPLDPRQVGRKVLVVDDNVDIAETLSSLLRIRGFQVETAFDPMRALEIAATFVPEVAVLDISLPVMTGYELGEKLQASQRRPLRLIAVTGFGQTHDERKSRDAGFAGHLVKPVDVEKLIALLIPS